MSPELLPQIPLVDPSDELCQRVLHAIHLEQKRRLRRQLIMTSVTVLLSASALVFFGVQLVQDMARSGFGAFLSLVFSDTTRIAMSWQDLGYAMLETLPAFSLAAVCVGFVSVCLCARSFVSSLRHWKQPIQMRQA